MALWTAFQPAAVIPQLLVEFLLPLMRTFLLFTFLLALIPMVYTFFIVYILDNQLLIALLCIRNVLQRYNLFSNWQNFFFETNLRPLKTYSLKNTEELQKGWKRDGFMDYAQREK